MPPRHRVLIPVQPFTVHCPNHYKRPMNPMFTHSHVIGSIRSVTNPKSTLVLPVLVCALLAGIALAPVETARAQTDVEPTLPAMFEEEVSKPGTNALDITSAPWRVHFGEHAAKVLEGSNPRAKLEALRDLIVVASYNEGRINLSETLTPLVGLFEQGMSTKHSLMALQALSQIGTEHSSESQYREAMWEVYQIAQEKSSEQVRRAAASVLHDFYGNDEDGR